MKNTLIHPGDIRKTKRVYIEWIDSVAVRGWQNDASMSDIDTEPSKICSIGFLIKNTKDFVTISTSVSINGNCMDPLTIPKVAVLLLRRLK